YVRWGCVRLAAFDMADCLHQAERAHHASKYSAVRNGRAESLTVIHDETSISRGAGLIHEFTHALAGTIDVDQAFMPGRCWALAKDRDFGPRVLANAQSYASFVEDAFG
ncbi:hypothetical protein, partial [Paraburkholderia podalyriae]|uniref:hypothetical protein n=1 Tax=Paraburkholderia podalyriae TaxID=1938811 RepID=UPI001CA46B6B